MHVLPHRLLDRGGTQAAPRTRPRRVARIAYGTEVAPALLTPRLYHTPPAPSADQETPQEISAWRRIALGALEILPQLALRPFPRLRVNDRRHSDGNPLTRGPLSPTLGVAGDAVFAAAWTIGLVDL